MSEEKKQKDIKQSEHPNIRFNQNASIHADTKFSTLGLNLTVWPTDGKYKTEAEWDSLTLKIISIITSHGLEVKGTNKVSGSEQAEIDFEKAGKTESALVDAKGNKLR